MAGVDAAVDAAAYVPVCLSTKNKPKDDDKCHGVTNEGYKFAAQQQAKTTYQLGAIDIAVMIAFALWQRKTSKNIAEMQELIADEQMRLAEKLHEHAKLFWAAEKALVDQAFGESRAATDYAGLGAGWKGFVLSGLSAGRQEWITEFQRHCAVPTQCEDARWQRTSSLMQADMLAFGARQAEARAQTLRDRRYERQYNALKLGHNILHYTMQFQSAALAIGTQAHNVLFGSVNSLLRETGYWAQYKQPTMWSHMSSGAQGAVFYEHANSARTSALAGFNANPVSQTALPAATPSVQVNVQTGKAGGLRGEGWSPELQNSLDPLYESFPKSRSALWADWKRD